MKLTARVAVLLAGTSSAAIFHAPPTAPLAPSPAAAPAASPAASPAAAPGAAPAGAPGAARPNPGSSKCPCVSIANIEGSTTVRISKNVTAAYPADLGAYCQAWDNNRNPVSCKPGQKPGKDNGWCEQPWCYVDPCNCDLDEPATKSPEEGGYQPGASYQGKGLWYSYKTCGGVDMWMDVQLKKKHQEKPGVCSIVKDEVTWGDEKCKCIGIANQAGATNVSLGKGKTMEYPADIGSQCRQWDFKRHPACLKQDPPDWCKQSWCYVDPCSCRIDTPPKSAGDAGYLPGAVGNGKAPLYYSYSTCGSIDSWAVGKDSAETKACISLKTKQACGKNKECGWGEKAQVCLKKDLVEVCTEDQLVKGSASSLTVGAAFLLSIATALIA